MATKPDPRSLRIIAGQWRGRKIQFADVDAIRPTPNRVRETLFNWLAPIMEGATCLDLFAGSGVLGFEAASRGAKSIIMVDDNPQAVNAIKSQVQQLAAQNIDVHRADASGFLNGVITPAPCDIVFLDPPFQSEMLADISQQLEDQGWLNPDAYIYIEMAARAVLPPLPDSWQPYRQKKAADVAYYLFQHV